MKEPLSIVHVVESVHDSLLLQKLLREEGLDCTISRVETDAQLREVLEQEECDLILSQGGLRGLDEFHALEVVRRQKRYIPVIFLVGILAEESAVESLQRGSACYVVSAQLSRLGLAIRRALAEKIPNEAAPRDEAALPLAARCEKIDPITQGLVHDMKNLLQIIKGHVSLLPLQVNAPDRLARTAEMLDLAAERGWKLVQELLLLARKSNLQLTRLDLAARIVETVSLVRAVLPHNIDIALRMDRELPRIAGDAEQIDRILTNVILNARDAMPAGGPITISAEVVPGHAFPAKPTWATDGLHLCLKIADSGVGMNEVTRRHAFEPFYTTKPKGSGHGVGLSVVLALMEVHRGFVELHSKPGKGTTVLLYFPLLAPSAVVA